MKRVAITYRRVSTDRQANKGDSLASQREAVGNYCEMRNFAVIKHCQDAGKSGRSREGRPGLEEAVKLACERKGVLVAYSLSRLSRSVIDAADILAELKAAGADLAIVDCFIDTTTAAGDLIFNVLNAIAQFESKMIGERIRMANARTVATKGYRTQGTPAAGWKVVNGQRIVVPAEKAVVDRVLQLRGAGASWNKIAEVLEIDDVPTITQLRGGQRKPWSKDMVKRLAAR